MGGGLAFRDAMAAEMPFSEEGGVVGFEDLRECWNARIERGVRVGVDPSLRGLDAVFVSEGVVRIGTLRDFHALIEVGPGVRRGCGDTES